MIQLADLFALRDHCEIRLTIQQSHTEIEAWTYPRPSDARQTLLASSHHTNTQLAVLDLMDQLAAA